MQDELVQGLLRRVRLATAEAEDTLAQSRRLVAARSLLRERALFRRCAWCSRVAIGSGWMGEEALPGFVPGRVVRRATHTICPDCTARLERDGLSHRRGR